MDKITVILQVNQEIEKAASKIWQAESELKKKETEAIHDMLVAMGGELSVDFDNDEYPTVVYDGGNHVEYASTINGVFSKIRPIEERGYKLFEVDFNEEPNYCCDRFCLSDIDSIFDYIRTKFSAYLFEEHIKNN